jgi:hypothetical protein
MGIRDIGWIVKGGGIIAALIVLVILIRYAWRRFLGIMRRIFPPNLLMRREIEQNHEIYIELVELRALTEADRTYVFRFHNGMEFLPSRPVWKISCTHEVVKHGVTYESAKLQSILVSLIPNIVGPIITGSSAAAGIKVSECPECPFQIRCLKENKRVIIIQVDEMESSYCKFHLEGQNIKTVVLCGIASGGNVFGFVGIDFCGTKLPADSVPDIAQKVCRSTEKIQYHLRYKKAPIDLPLPNRPITSASEK